MTRSHWIMLILAIGLVFPMEAFAYSALACNNGQPVAGTSLYDDSSTGACQFTGIRYIFSTIICQFVTMINMVMGKLYCSIQAAAKPIVLAGMTVFVAIYGVQMLMGTAQLNSAEVVTRLLKMSLIAWLLTDSTFGVSGAIAYMFNFFISFISETTRWVVRILDQYAGLNLYVDYSFDPGVTATFKYLDDWLYNALTGSLSQANSKVVGFFVAMFAVVPSIFWLALYWFISVLKMLVTTLITFLMAIIAISFLLGLSPIFISFILFQVTFQYFDQWLRFMIAYSMQVMISFGILTLWIFSLTLFSPFFNELSEVIYPYQKIIKPAAAVLDPANSWGLCPIAVFANPIPHVQCENPNFDPYNSNDDRQKIIPPSRVPEMNHFLLYVFYHLITLIIVCYGFASLQKNASSIARQLGGPSYVPVLNAMGMGSNSFGHIQKTAGETNQFMQKHLFSGFFRRHESGQTPYEKMLGGMRDMAGGR